MCCLRLIRILIALACALWVQPPAAHAQAMPALPDPMRVREIERTAELLELTPPQREALLSGYDRYLERYARVRERDVAPFVDAVTALADRIGIMEFDIPDRDEIDRMIALGLKAMDRIGGADGSFFDDLSGMLDEQQQRMLARLRLTRQLDAYRLIALPMVGELNPGLKPHLSELVIAQGIEQTPEVMAMLESYEKRYLRGARDIFDGVQEALYVVLDIIDELGIRDMEQQEMFMIFADPERIEDLKRRADDLSRPLQEAAYVLSQLNWRTWKSLDGMLGEDDAKDLAWKFLGRGYRRSVRGYRDLDLKFDVIIGLASIDEDQRTLIEQAHASFSQKAMRNATRYAEYLEKSREYRSINQFEGDESGEWDEQIEQAEEARERLVDSTKQQLESLMTEAMTAELDEAKESKQQAKATQAIVIGGSTSGGAVDVTIESGDLVPAAGKVKISGPIPAGHTRHMATILNLAEGDAAVLDTLYDDYRVSWDAVRDEAAATWEGHEEGELSNAAAARALRELEQEAKEQVAALDAVFFEDLSNALGLDAEHPDLHMLTRHRARIRSNSNDNDPWGMSRSGQTIDLVAIYLLEKPLSLSAEGTHTLREALRGYHELMDAPAAELASAADQLERLQTATFLMEEASVDRDSGAVMSAVRDRWTKAIRAMRDAAATAARVNQDAVDALLSALPQEDYWPVRKRFVKRAYPRIFDEDKDLSTMLSAANEIPKLDSAQRGLLDRLGSDYQSSYWEICERMIDLRSSESQAAPANGFFSQADAKRELEIERLRFQQSELNDRLQMRLRMVLTEDQVKAIPGLRPSVLNRKG